MRPTFDTTFLDVAEIISRRSTCPRARVGAVITVDNRIVSTGYNGALSGEDHCDDVGCLIVEEEGDHCQRAIHAEMNAIAQAAAQGIPIQGGTLYYWDSRRRSAMSCYKCWQLMRSVEIDKIVDREGNMWNRYSDV
jgi:dCMP deaminase